VQAARRRSHGSGQPIEGGTIFEVQLAAFGIAALDRRGTIRSLSLNFLVAPRAGVRNDHVIPSDGTW
jgi:hypothetical protein